MNKEEAHQKYFRELLNQFPGEESCGQKTACLLNINGTDNILITDRT
jgi:hypothetical protein